MLEDKEKNTNQRLEDLQYSAQHPRLAMDADVTTDKKICKRAEHDAANRVKNDDSFSARVNDGPIS